MNKAFILLLVTLVQSQSDGVLLAESNANDRGFRGSQLEDWEDPESPYTVDMSKDSPNDANSQPYRKRSVTSDTFTRRSSLDKNFMRFGRGDDAPQKRCGRSRGKVSFYRFGRGLKDGFIRFGRARDDFIRFGRGGGKDGFIRFGRTRPEDFYRAGKSVRENFIRFGKADKNFMRFGRGGADEDYEDFSSEEPFQRLEKSARTQDNFLRFGKNGKNGTNFLRFGKSSGEGEETEEGEGKRRRRGAGEEPPGGRKKRSTGYFEVLPEDFPRRFFPVPSGSFRSLEPFGNSRATPFFPAFSEPLKAVSEAKRNQGGSNFIRLLEEYRDSPEELDVNCADSLRRTALIAAIENENLDLVQLLLEWDVDVKDGLLRAIEEEFVEAVELLLDRQDAAGRPYSWEALDPSSATYPPDVTPIILAAHVNNYEIVKMLLDRGATLPRPHDVRCGCDECIASSRTDSLRHSRARINAYKALTASSFLALSSDDPLLTAFELSRELHGLSHYEAEFRAEYDEMRAATEEFATGLLNHARTSSELQEVLNYDGETWEPGDRQTLHRLKLAIKYGQKKFVAHPNVQQLLASIWYDGLPGFRRQSTLRQIAEVLRLACLLPFYSVAYATAPDSRTATFVRKPFVKFILHSSSHAVFLVLLGLASQRVEHFLAERFGSVWMMEERRERAPLPGVVEILLFVFVASSIWGEVRALWSNGLREFVSDPRHAVDFIANCFYLIWICLRFTAIYIVEREARLGRNPFVPREEWHPFDPILLSEGAFAAAMIFSFLKLVHVFSVNPHLGPLQVSLGRMTVDILKFFFVYTLVLIAFGCGTNQLMWYYANLEKSKCYGTFGPDVPDFENNEKACTVWRRFANLFETSQSLFWASFGLVDLTSFDLAGMKSFTRFWGLLLFGCYSVISIVVLLNMLIAMMSNSYQIISERADVEWKFARSRLWMSYFNDDDVLPPPFNLIPTVKTLPRMFGLGETQRSSSFKEKSRTTAKERHKAVMESIIGRFVAAEQRKKDRYGITEDDVMEIRQDISTLRHELMDVFGMRSPEKRGNLASRRRKAMERRLEATSRCGSVPTFSRRSFRHCERVEMTEDAVGRLLSASEFPSAFDFPCSSRVVLQTEV